jgi:hypothetical protein
VRWRRSTRGAVDDAPYQEVAARFPAIATGAFARAVHLIETDGSWSSGAEAVLRSLAHGRRARGCWWLYRRVPPFAAVSEWVYRLVASHRGAFSTLTRWWSRLSR